MDDDPCPRTLAAAAVNSYTSSLPGPKILHCSAGIGRTGTFCAIDMGMRQLDTERRVDILDIVCRLREDRGGMVQTQACLHACAQGAGHCAITR